MIYKLFFSILLVTLFGDVKSEEIKCPYNRNTGNGWLSFQKIYMKWNSTDSTAELCFACIADVYINIPVNTIGVYSLQ